MVLLRCIIHCTPVPAHVRPEEVNWTNVLGREKRLQLDISSARDRLAKVVQAVPSQLGVPFVGARGNHLFSDDIKTTQSVEHPHRIRLVVWTQTHGVRVRNDGFPLRCTIWGGQMKALRSVGREDYLGDGDGPLRRVVQPDVASRRVSPTYPYAKALMGDLLY